MTLFFHAFRMLPADPSEQPRMSRLDWTIVNSEGKLVRGFSFNIDPTDWGMTEHGAVNESGDSFDRIAAIGHPIEMVIKKFIADHDACEYLVAVDMQQSLEAINYEAVLLGLAPKTRIMPTHRYSAQQMQGQDFTGGIQPLVEYFYKTCPSQFQDFKIQTEITT